MTMAVSKPPALGSVVKFLCGKRHKTGVVVKHDPIDTSLIHVYCKRRGGYHQVGLNEIVKDYSACATN